MWSLELIDKKKLLFDYFILLIYHNKILEQFFIRFKIHSISKNFQLLSHFRSNPEYCIVLSVCHVIQYLFLFIKSIGLHVLKVFQGIHLLWMTCNTLVMQPNKVFSHSPTPGRGGTVRLHQPFFPGSSSSISSVESAIFKMKYRMIQSEKGIDPPSQFSSPNIFYSHLLGVAE